MKVLSYREDYYTMGCIIAFSLLILFPFFGTITLYQYPIYMLISFHFSFCVNVINHNHTHVPTFKNIHLNDLFDYWLTLLRGGSAIFIKIVHNINHHQHVGAKEDWFSPENQKGSHKFLSSFVYLYVTFKRFRKEGKVFDLKMGGDYLKKKKIERILLFVFVSILLLISVKKFLFFVLIPWVFGNSFLVYTNLIFHKYGDPNDKYNHSYNFTNKVENALYFNGGYHTIHHLNPTLHWSLLPAKHRELISGNIGPKLMENSMFLHAIKLNLSEHAK